MSVYYPWSASTTIDVCLLPVVYIYYHRSVSTTLGQRLPPLVESLYALVGLGYAPEMLSQASLSGQFMQSVFAHTICSYCDTRQNA